MYVYSHLPLLNIVELAYLLLIAEFY